MLLKTIKSFGYADMLIEVTKFAKNVGQALLPNLMLLYAYKFFLLLLDSSVMLNCLSAVSLSSSEAATDLDFHQLLVQHFYQLTSEVNSCETPISCHGILTNYCRVLMARRMLPCWPDRLTIICSYTIACVQVVLDFMKRWWWLTLWITLIAVLIDQIFGNKRSYCYCMKFDIFKTRPVSDWHKIGLTRPFTPAFPFAYWCNAWYRLLCEESSSSWTLWQHSGSHIRTKGLQCQMKLIFLFWGLDAVYR